MNETFKMIPGLIGLVGIIACSPPPPTKDSLDTLTTDANSRVTVTRINEFYDSLAYRSRRGIYIIVDTKTGKEFLGVSGIGISELGSHQSGKTRASDER
jgi:hypothetical protein